MMLMICEVGYHVLAMVFCFGTNFLILKVWQRYLLRVADEDFDRKGVKNKKLFNMDKHTVSQQTAG